MSDVFQMSDKMLTNGYSPKQVERAIQILDEELDIRLKALPRWKRHLPLLLVRYVGIEAGHATVKRFNTEMSNGEI